MGTRYVVVDYVFIYCCYNNNDNNNNNNNNLPDIKSKNYKVTLHLSKVTWSALGPGNAGKART